MGGGGDISFSLNIFLIEIWYVAMSSGPLPNLFKINVVLSQGLLALLVKYT